MLKKDGSFSDVQVIDDKFRVGAEAVRALKTMPAWIPAVHNQKNVRSAFTLPITINVNDSKKNLNKIFTLQVNKLKILKIVNH